MADINVGAISEALNNKADVDLHNLNNEGKKSVTLAGMVMAFAGTTAPTGWLKCDGSAISRTTYAALFNVIGTTYGAGDGSTTFNLPTQSVLPLGISAPIVFANNGNVQKVKTTTGDDSKTWQPGGQYSSGLCSSASSILVNEINDNKFVNSVIDLNGTHYTDLTKATGAKAIVCIKY